jgi:hypothetical protein
MLLPYYDRILDYSYSFRCTRTRTTKKYSMPRRISMLQQLTLLQCYSGELSVLPTASNNLLEVSSFYARDPHE